MIKLDNVTLVSMSSVNMDLTIKALEKSMEQIEFNSVKLITHEKPNFLTNKIEFCYIDKINNVNEYSFNMIYKLSDYINTEYVLVIQSDGYVVNVDSWKDEFLNYDYIGAPFMLPNDDFSYRDINGNIFRVGNGGFSLRSKKLIDLPNKLNLEWKAFHGFYNEDGFICAMNRHIYEENGCKFAPLEIAKYFSHEHQIPETYNINPFGFHGKFSKWYKNN
jgi:hypothetical protein